MFSHIVLGTNSIAEAKRFYDAALGALGYPPGHEMNDRLVYSSQAHVLMITAPYDGQPATFGNGVTIGLIAPNPQAVDAFHGDGIAAGGTDEGSPGPRAAIPNSYAAYLRDPTGNKLVAWCVRSDGGEGSTDDHGN